MSGPDDGAPAAAPPPPPRDGLLTWLLGGLVVGLVVLGASLIAYTVGYDRGQDSVASAPPVTLPAETTPAETTPAETTPAETTPAETEPAETEPAAPDGASVFADAGCGACHTLAAAGTTGTVGPNLDELAPTQEMVVTIVTDGRGAMPSFSGQLDPEEIEAVATYVSDAAGG